MNDPIRKISTHGSLFHPSVGKLRARHRQQDFQFILDLFDEQAPETDEEKTIYALTLMMSGRIDNSSALLHKVADQDPDPKNPLWQSDVALARFFCGQIEESFSLLQKSVSSSEATAVEFSRLAAVHFARGNLEEARDNYLEAVMREPGRAEWHNNLAGILVRQQKLEEALENYDQALLLKPDMERPKRSRQQVLIALERSDELVAELQAALEHDPDDYLLRVNLARAYNLDNRPGEAIKLLRNELVPVEEIEKPRGNEEERAKPAGEQKTPGQGQAPESRELYNAQFAFRQLLAEIFSSRSLHGRALAFLKQLEQMEPDHPVPIICKQATTLSEMMRHEQALEKLDAIEQDYPDNNNIKTTRANILCEKGDYAQAEGILRELLKTYPGDAGLLTQLGQTLLWVGDLEEAAECFERASEINPMALAQMVNARKIPEDPKALEKMQTFADNPLLPDVARQNMNFALSTVYDKQKDYDNAFHYLDQANRLANKSLTYNPDGFSKKTAAVAKIFNQQFFANLKPIRKSDRTPIFVVGMPRSGTTLTEQILSSHPEIFGAGELPILPRLTGLLPRVLKVKQQFPWCVVRMNPHLREEAARHYLYNLYEYDSEHPYVVDKMPHNFVNLGLIAMIFPRARIIHVQRDPRDIALSNLQQNFKARHGGLGYAFDQVKTARQINDYHRLMAHWRRVLPLPIFDLSYEQTVEDLEGMATKLLDFVGVDWHDDVKSFYETKRAVRTASVTQVRQPIYTTSMKKWKRYESHLGELLDNLNPDVTEPYDNPTEDTNPYVSRIVHQGRITRLT